MSGARCGALLALTAWFASACNGTLRFDETPRDAGGSDPAREMTAEDADIGDGDDAGDSVSTDAPCSDSANCGWRIAECGPGSDDPCELHCESGRACPDGMCGAGCVADCEKNSSCSIAAGSAAHLECNSGASCSFTLGANANAICVTGSNCRVQCAGHCALNCQAGATCQLRCSDSADGQAVTGMVVCP